MSDSPRKRVLRAVLALVLLGLHLAAVATLARTRFAGPFNAAPGTAPEVIASTPLRSPAHWNRLAVARWDSAHYINLALRGYDSCPPDAVATRTLPKSTMACDLGFYPGYPLVGRLLSGLTGLPADSALLLISLLSSFVFLFLWTGPSLRESLGATETWVAFVAFNLFATGFTLVTIYAEPLTLALTLGAFAALHNRRLAFGAFLAGGATGGRINGVATGVAFALALLWLTWQERPLPLRTLLWRLGLSAVSVWGVAAMMGYFWFRFGDPFAYEHAYSESHGHSPGVMALLLPDRQWLLTALGGSLHDGFWLLAVLLFLAVGIRPALRRFPAHEKVFFYVLTVVATGVAGVGSAHLAFGGWSRYSLLILPVFFAMGTIFARRPVFAALWLAFSAFHYWNIDLCYYVGGPGQETIRRCGVALSGSL